LHRYDPGCVEGTAEECLASKELIGADYFPTIPASEWTAPYAQYAGGWWETFYPGNENK
jgi:hypothetical protein